MKIQPEEFVALEEQPCVIDGSPGVQVRCYCTCGKLVRIDKFDEHVWDEYMRDHYIPILDQYGRHCGRKLVFKKALYKQIEREKTVEAEAEASERHRYLPVRSCPKCDGDTSVIETRENSDGTIRRRRVCLSCGHRFSTMEIFYNYKNKSTSEV